jgi:putative DNA primase/helicase
MIKPTDRNSQERLSDRLARVANGRWAEIIDRSGIEVGHNPSKKTACPLHTETTSKRKFRFENKDGAGNWHCSECGHGTGMDLLMKGTGKTFIEAAKWVIAEFDSNAQQDRPALAPRRVVAPKERSLEDVDRTRAAYERVWNEARPVVDGDPVALYLKMRIPGLTTFPPVLRFHPAMPFFGIPRSDGTMGRNYGTHPCMIAAVVDDKGRCCNIHRTFLTDKGKKLSLQEPDEDDPTSLLDLPAKKLMGSIGVRHYQIRLARPVDGVLGVAEGIETALAATVYSSVPTWSLVATTGMVNFLVPAEVTRLIVFADNDKLTSRGVNPGLDAARALVERQDVMDRIEAGTLKVVIRTPETSGTDMVDFIQAIARANSVGQ